MHIHTCVCVSTKKVERKKRARENVFWKFDIFGSIFILHICVNYKNLLLVFILVWLKKLAIKSLFFSLFTCLFAHLFVCCM